MKQLIDGLRDSTIPKTERKHAAAREIEKMRMGLENCRLLAARHRKEDWALLILGFCAEAGVVGSVMRRQEDGE